jgi:hypothetical protein
MEPTSQAVDLVTLGGGHLNIILHLTKENSVIRNLPHLDLFTGRKGKETNTSNITPHYRVIPG